MNMLVTCSATRDWLQAPLRPQSPTTSRLSDPSFLAGCSSRGSAAAAGSHRHSSAAAARTARTVAALPFAMAFAHPEPHQGRPRAAGNQSVVSSQQATLGPMSWQLARTVVCSMKRRETKSSGQWPVVTDARPIGSRCVSGSRGAHVRPSGPRMLQKIVTYGFYLVIFS